MQEFGLEADMMDYGNDRWHHRLPFVAIFLSLDALIAVAYCLTGSRGEVGMTSGRYRQASRFFGPS